MSPLGLPQFELLFDSQFVHLHKHPKADERRVETNESHVEKRPPNVRCGASQNLNAFRISADPKKRKRPRLNRVAGRSFDQSSPENCSAPPYVQFCTVGMARLGYCGNQDPQGNHKRLEVVQFEINGGVSCGMPSAAVLSCA